ncbi:MAG: c-type cytochrome [Thermodesulfobacteriota bacterium]
MFLRYCAKAALVLIVVSVFAGASFAATAAQNYHFYCAQCHGLEGRGDGPNATRSQPVDPRDHTSAYEMNKLTDAEIIGAITGGGAATSKSTLMPPFGKTLTKREIKDLKDYLRKLCKCKGK